jgi:hypothetical protein
MLEMVNPDQVKMVPGFTHLPGHHCGSTALRNLLAFGGTGISEEMAFGLGAGAGFYYLTVAESSPSRWFNGRTAKLEDNFRELTDGALECRTFEDDASAWAEAKAAIDSGEPVLLLTDLYYLDHYGDSAHFPGHAVVLAGYDDESAILSDTGFEQLQTTRLEHLSRARRSDHPWFRLEGNMFTLADGFDPGALGRAIEPAIRRAVQEMLDPTVGEFGGLPAVKRFAEEAPHWPEVAEDWQWCARFAYQVIERRGTGGGAFRPMYSRFLAEAGMPGAAELASAAGRRWTDLAVSFKLASESEDPDPGLWAGLGEDAAAVFEAEERFWITLSARPE